MIKKRKRAMITVDAEQWDRLQRILDLEGYPSGSMSFYLRRCVSSLESYLCVEYDKETLPVHPSDPIADLEISRLGLQGAAQRFGWDIPDWVDEEEDYQELFGDELDNPTETKDPTRKK